jgi:hypothetical protein
MTLAVHADRHPKRDVVFVDHGGTRAVTESHQQVSAEPVSPPAADAYGTRFWRYTIPLVAAIAFLKGFRKPNVWSYTQAQFDYSTGFMRRGFFGWLLRPAGIHLYSHFAVFSTFLLLLLFFQLVRLAFKSEILRLAPPGELVAVYASSFSVSYLAHLNGYLDIPLAILCVIPLFFRSVSIRLAAAVACSCIGILIHEQFLFAFLPVLIVAVLFGAPAASPAVASNKPASRLLPVGGAILLTVIGLVLLGIFARYGSLTESRAQVLEATAQARVDQPLSHEVFKIAPRTASENLQIMKAVWARRTFLPAQLESFLIFGPSAAVLSWGSLILLRSWRPKDYRLLYAGVLLATLAPLSLNLVGWDKNRWNELVCFNAFVLLLLISRLFARGPVRFPTRFRQACLVVILINMATGGGLLDQRHIRPWPFMRNPDAQTTSASPS